MVEKSKILVLGNGFLGNEFKRNGFTVWDSKKFRLKECIGKDIFSSLNPFYDQLKTFDVIINCIGVSDTRYCEDQRNLGTVLFTNSTIPRLLSTWCSVNNTKFVQISTGCLYDEIGRPCTEEDFIAAHCTYTVSKYVGEKHCRHEKDLIIRPRLLFSGYKAFGRNNLVEKLLKFDTFVDEFNSVTWNQTIVEAVEALLKADVSGIFNVANEGIHTIHDIARMLGKDGKKMSGAELRESQGLYLVNNVMDLTKLKQYYQPPTVEEAIKRCHEQLKLVL